MKTIHMEIELTYDDDIMHALCEIERLRWIPERDPDRGEWADGWNRCLEYILDKRAGIKPGTRRA